MEYIENKTDKASISIGQAFLIIGILLVVSLPVSLLQMSALQRLPESKSWIMLFSYMLQFGATLLITVKIFIISADFRIVADFGVNCIADTDARLYRRTV